MSEIDRGDRAGEISFCLSLEETDEIENCISSVLCRSCTRTGSIIVGTAPPKELLDDCGEDAVKLEVVGLSSWKLDKELEATGEELMSKKSWWMDNWDIATGCV